MSAKSFIQLLLLAAIWGASFLFIRVAVPHLGPAMLIGVRVLLAALFLLAVAVVTKRVLKFGKHFVHYLILGALNSALPFLLFAYAAQTLSASLLSILNATAPIWGALIGVVWLGNRLDWKTALGLLLGAGGVAILVGFDSVTVEPNAGLAIAAALLAALLYSIASIYAKNSKRAQGVRPFANAHGSMWTSVLIIAPLLLFFPVKQVPTLDIIGAVVILGVVCSGIAYLLYFKLIEDVGPTPALTVTFLIPVFGVFWGYSLLDEQVGWHTLVGSLAVIGGTILVTGFRFSALRKSH